eukprot:109906-Prymnesium_polylepis.1
MRVLRARFESESGTSVRDEQKGAGAAAMYRVGHLDRYLCQRAPFPQLLHARQRVVHSLDDVG